MHVYTPVFHFRVTLVSPVADLHSVSTLVSSTSSSWHVFD